VHAQTRSRDWLPKMLESRPVKTRLTGLISALLLPSVFLLVSCSGDPERDASLLVVQDAADKEILRSEDGKRVQISYKVNRPFPAVAVGKDEAQRLEREGWKPCEGGNIDWGVVADAQEKRLVHQLTRHWVRDGDLLTANMRYLSPLAEPVRQGTPPESSVQHVTILLDRYGASIAEVVTQLKLRC